MRPCLLIAFALGATAQIASAPPEPLGRLIGVGGYRVHLYCTGSGNPTVMVVGAGFSFDWALVQPEVARFATICTYDVSGTAWSDPGPRLTCRARVNEVHDLIHAAHLRTPLVLTGLSIGGCVARLYAAQFPSEVAGMVIVDHAFSPDPPPPDPDAPHHASEPGITPPILIYQAPIAVRAEDISSLKQLPDRIQQLHQWAMSLNPVLPTWDDAEDCLTELKSAAPGSFPLADRPLVVVSTTNQARGYTRLQSQLLALSRNSSQLIAARSFHSVEIDQPEVLVQAIKQVVDKARR
jgi:pimeloyl-ACP methyl ester carboxylesterase